MYFSRMSYGYIFIDRIIQIIIINQNITLHTLKCIHITYITLSVINLLHELHDTYKNPLDCDIADNLNQSTINIAPYFCYLLDKHNSHLPKRIYDQTFRKSLHLVDVSYKQLFFLVAITILAFLYIAMMTNYPNLCRKKKKLVKHGSRLLIRVD